jgi:phenylacetate-CoA ligase
MSIYHYLNEKLILPLADRAMGTEILRYTEMIQDMSTWSYDQITIWQNKRLKELINHVYRNTKFYRELFDQNDIIPSDIDTVADLKNFPVLSKDDILNSPEKFIPDNLSDIRYKHAATGGSTGEPLQYYLDLRSYNYITAMRCYHFHKAGYRSGDKLLIIGSGNIVPNQKTSLKYKLFYLLNRRYNVEAANLSDQIADGFLKLLANKNVQYIYGYASSIYLLARRAEKTKLKLPALNTCFTTAEMLHDKYRETIETIFNCRVIDSYGAADGGISAYESEKGKYLCGYNAICEIEASTKRDGTGDLLVTDLLNYATPFVRYCIKDRVSLLNSEIAQKFYNGQVISKVWGRSSEFIVLENGHILNSVSIAMLFRLINARAFRIRKTGKLQLVCEIEKNEKFTPSEEDMIRNTFSKHAGEDCILKIEYVDKFDTLSSGKRNYFITEF